MFSQIVMVHLRLKLKVMRKGLVPKQLDLFQNQPKIVCIQGPQLSYCTDGLSRLEVTHTGGTSSSWDSMEWWPCVVSSALNTLAFLHKHQELVKINLYLLQQHVAQTTHRELNTEHSGEVGPGPQPGRGITRHHARRR